MTHPSKVKEQVFESLKSYQGIFSNLDDSMYYLSYTSPMLNLGIFLSLLPISDWRELFQNLTALMGRIHFLISGSHLSLLLVCTDRCFVFGFSFFFSLNN